MLNTKLRRTALVSLVVVLMLSVFAMTAFAEDVALITSTNAGESVDVATAPEADADLEVGTVVADEEVKAEDATEVEASDATTTGTVTEEEHDHDHDHEEEAADEGFTTSDLVLLIIFGVAVIVCAILCVIKREKVGKFLRGLKSEFKKIVWSPWNQVKKNVIVVIVVVIVLAVVIGLLDFLFGHGITELKKIINP